MVAVPASDVTPEPALYRAIDGAREAFPIIALGSYPTPVERVAGLVPGAELWVKREDRCSEIYGGNKVRKLEFMLGQARRDGRRRLMTFGGWGSHHAMATAVHGPRHGFEVETIAFPQPLDDHVKELLLAQCALGARLTPVGSMAGVVPHRVRALRSASTAWLAGGGSSAVGSLGWVSAGFEIAEQIASGALPRPDIIYGALGSCGTMAGLCWSLAAEPLTLVGVRVVNRPMGKWATEHRMRALDDLLGPMSPRPRARRARLRVEHGFIGRGYGFATRASQEAVRAAARFGLALEPIYTGKVLAALLSDAAAGRLRGKRVLFLQTNATTDLAAIARAGPGPEALPERLRALFAARLAYTRHRPQGR